MPTISVVIPVYNGAKTIRETIASVLAQSFEDLEVLVINDGSTDETGEIVQRIADPRLKLLNYPNAGLAASRNRGIHRAKGEYISFIDADDLWTPDKLAAQYQALQEHPQAQVAYSWTDWIDLDDRLIRPAARLSFEGRVYEYLVLLDFLGCGSNPLIRREFLLHVGGFDESLPAAEDWDLWIRLAAQGEFVCVRSPQILYRQVPNSMSRHTKRQGNAGLRVIAKTFAAAPPNLQYLKPRSLANFHRGMLYRSLMSGLNQTRAIAALGHLLQSIRYDPTFLRARVLLKVIIQIGLGLLLPPQLSHRLIIGPLADINAIHGYMQIYSRPQDK